LIFVSRYFKVEVKISKLPDIPQTRSEIFVELWQLTERGYTQRRSGSNTSQAVVCRWC